jgi:hypothetical protein
MLMAETIRPSPSRRSISPSSCLESARDSKACNGSQETGHTGQGQAQFSTRPGAVHTMSVGDRTLSQSCHCQKGTESVPRDPRARAPTRSSDEPRQRGVDRVLMCFTLSQATCSDDVSASAPEAP